MAIEAAALVGAWRKAPGPACAAQYPARLQLEPNGLYSGASDPPGEFTTWDVGTWKIEGAELAVSTANDAIVRYQCSVSGQVLHLTDPAGCHFSYARET